MKITFEPIGARLRRAWLRYRLDNYSRCLRAIAAQRENDFHAERMLHRAVSATRSRLQALEAAGGAPDVKDQPGNGTEGWRKTPPLTTARQGLPPIA